MKKISYHLEENKTHLIFRLALSMEKKSRFSIVIFLYFTLVYKKYNVTTYIQHLR